MTRESHYIERIIKNLSHDNVYLRWAAVFDLGAIGQSHEVVQAIIAARIPNNLKLLNLKQILEARLNGDAGDPTPSDAGLLFNAIDDLLIQL